jgi:pseudouridine kinase
MSSPDVICLGGATLDRKYRALSRLAPGTSNPVEGMLGFGGVARNVCENLARLGVSASLASLVGEDAGGQALIAHLRAAGAATDLTELRPGLRTAEYVAALESDGGLAFGLADMAIFDAFTGADLDRIWPALQTAQWLFADCNLPAGVLAELIERRRSAGFKLAIDPVSVAKAKKLPEDLTGVDLLVLNREEMAALVGDHLAPSAAMGALIRRGVKRIVLTNGAADIHVADGGQITMISPEPADVRDVTGAGDALMAAILAWLLKGAALVDAVRQATRVAALTVASPLTVRHDLSNELLSSALRSSP